MAPPLQVTKLQKPIPFLFPSFPSRFTRRAASDGNDIRAVMQVAAVHIALDHKKHRVMPASRGDDSPNEPYGIARGIKHRVASMPSLPM